MQTNTVRNMFGLMGYDFNTMKVNEPIDINGWEIKSFENNKDTWKPITKIVKKQISQHIKLTTDSGKVLSCSPEHKIFVRANESNKSTFEEVCVLMQNEKHYSVLTENGWENFQIIDCKESIEIADLEVEGTNCYYSNGILSHNTAYGDPVTTPGGLAIPYAASLRIRLLGGSQIKKTINGKEVVIGINVSAKTIKNKVGRPWREVEFEIHFGKGVVEEEQLFNSLREHCEKSPTPVIAADGNKVVLSGTGGWKYFQVSSPTTGEIIHDEKFQKSTFKSNILDNPKYEMYMKALMDDCFIIKTESSEHKTLASVNLDSEVERSAFEQEKEGK